MVFASLWAGAAAAVGVVQTTVQIIVWLYQLLVAAGLYLWLRTCGGIVAFSTLLMPGFMAMTLRLLYDPPTIIVKDLPFGTERRQFVDVYIPQTGVGAARIRELVDRHGGKEAAVENELRHGAPVEEGSSTTTRPGGAPVLVFLAGGAWTIGYKYWGAGLGFRLAERGAVVITSDYRQFPQASINGMLDDVGLAMRWVVRNAARFGGDPNKIILLGQSAGAHLATLYTFRAVETLRYRAEGGESSGLPAPGHCGGVALPAAVVGLSGVYHMQSAVTPFRRRGMTDEMVLGIFGGFDAAAMDAASPLTVLEGLARRTTAGTTARPAPAEEPLSPAPSASTMSSPRTTPSAFALLLGSEVSEIAEAAAGMPAALAASDADVANSLPGAGAEPGDFPSLPSSGAGTPRDGEGGDCSNTISIGDAVGGEGAGEASGGAVSAQPSEEDGGVCVGDLQAEAGAAILLEAERLRAATRTGSAPSPGRSDCLEAARRAVLFVLLHGSGDGIANVAQAERLFEELRAGGWRAALGVYTGASHTGPLIEEAMGEKDYLLEDVSDICRHVSTHVDSRSLASVAGDTVRTLRFGERAGSVMRPTLCDETAFSIQDADGPSGGPLASVAVQGRRGIIKEGSRSDSKPSETAFGGHCSPMRRLTPDFLIWLGKAANPF